MMYKSSIEKPSTQFIVQALSAFDVNCPKALNLADYRGDLTNDSRSISNEHGRGDIFCAIIGHIQDGRQYIAKAIANGAKLVLSECENESQHGVISFANEHVAIISFYQLNKQLFTLASAYYQYPEKSMTMIGITGTNGKTSTSQLLGQILTSCQKPCAIIGTNGAGMVDDLLELENTTPSATELMQLFSSFSQKKVSNENVSHLAMEVSSHALEQGRVTGNVFDIAVFTNLSRDHLDYHGTMAHYAAAKRQLFTNSEKQFSVLNGDDVQARFWLENWPKSGDSSPQKLWLYGHSELVRQHALFVSCDNIKHHGQGVNFTLNTHLGDIEIHSPLLGDFNIDNGLMAIAAARHAGVPSHIAIEALAKFINTKRRFELKGEVNNIRVFDDFAHHPTAITKTLAGVRAQVDSSNAQGRVFAVLEPRSNTMKSGVHKDDLPLALRQADQVFIFQDEGIKWSVDELVDHCHQPCFVEKSINDLVSKIIKQCQAGDTIVVMSNGGFGNIHDKILTALAS